MEIIPENLIQQENVPFTNDDDDDDDHYYHHQQYKKGPDRETNVTEIEMQTTLDPLAHDDGNYNVVTKNKPPKAKTTKQKTKIIPKKVIVKKSTPAISRASSSSSSSSSSSLWMIYAALVVILCAYAYLPMSQTPSLNILAYQVLKYISNFSTTSFKKNEIDYTNTPYDLWTSPHNTKSNPIEYTLKEAKKLSRALEIVFKTHLTQNPDIPCLCMHHLHVDRILKKVKDAKIDQLILYQICGVYNKEMDQMYVMANPRISGGGNKTSVYSEKSVACQSKNYINRKRSSQVFIDWIDPQSEDNLYYKFNGFKSACLQLAMDEFKGDAHCLQQ